jgi:hypothetical protein
MATRQKKRKPTIKPKPGSFAAVVEAVDRLSIEEQEELTRIVRRRLAAQGRLRVLQDVREAEAEFAAGGCPVATVREIMEKILK